MDPLLKRALIKSNPSYFSLSEEEQLRYRLELDDHGRFIIDKYILKGLFDLNARTEDELEDLFDSLSNEQSTQFNTIMLPLLGIGEDNFFLNERFQDGMNISHFETLYDYDFQDFEFQEASRSKEIKLYKAKPYLGSLYAVWARLIIDQQFAYATLDMAAFYIIEKTDDFAFEIIERLIPHDYLDANNQEAVDGEPTVLNYKINAHGKERQLEDLKSRKNTYIIKRQDEILADFDKKSLEGVYILNEENPDEPAYNFIFTDTKILKETRLKYFLRDCKKHELQDHSSFLAIIEKEKAALKTFLEKEYKDITDNFDPKVVKLKRNQ